MDEPVDTLGMLRGDLLLLASNLVSFGRGLHPYDDLQLWTGWVDALNAVNRALATLGSFESLYATRQFIEGKGST